MCCVEQLIVVKNGGKQPKLFSDSYGDVGFHPGNPDFVQIYHNMIIRLFDEFADGIRKKSNESISNTLADGFKSTSTVIYGDMAYRVKSEIAVDIATMNIRNNNNFFWSSSSSDLNSLIQSFKK